MTQPAECNPSLLIQGLKSNDKDILDSILHNVDNAFILRTVQQLPLDLVSPMIEEITRRIQKGDKKTLCYLSWLRIIIIKNMSFLQSHPKKQSFLDPLLISFKQETVLLPALMGMKGRLDLIFSQIQDTTENQFSLNKAKHYHDESDDDIFEAADDMSEANSDEEKKWEELSYDSGEGDEDDGEEDESMDLDNDEEESDDEEQEEGDDDSDDDESGDDKVESDDEEEESGDEKVDSNDDKVDSDDDEYNMDAL